MWNANIVAERLSFSSDIWVEKVSAGVILQYIWEYRYSWSSWWWFLCL